MLAKDFHDLPLRILYLDEPGQCSSRNTGLQVARGEYVLFADDDIEVTESLIESHLRNLERFGADVSSGVVHEVGGDLPENFRYLRLSDVFPMGNTLIRRAFLHRSGLLDLAYEHGTRADGDLGMRVYLAGALMILNPEIWVLHHRAPRGGLRAHGARIITRAISRDSLIQRDLPSTTEIYLAKRYFTPRQGREILCLRMFSTLSLEGGRFRRIMKMIISTIFLPHTWWYLRSRKGKASQMLNTYPVIPVLSNCQSERTESDSYTTMEEG